MDWGMGGLLGLGGLSDIFGAYSAYQQQQRQRALYNKNLEINNILQNPNLMVAGSQPYYQANLAAMRSALPEFMRSTVNPGLGVSGIDPSGGYGQLLAERAIAPQIQNAWTNAQQSYANSLGGAQQGLNYASQGIGQPAGGMGNTAAALRTMMLINAMRTNSSQPNPQPGLSAYPAGTSGVDFNSYGGGMNWLGSDLVGGPAIGGGQTLGPQLDFGYSTNPYASRSVFGQYGGS